MIGKDIARFHTIFWPAMLWSAGLEAPRRVWVHGWLLAQGERMSKSRGNFLDPLDFVAAFGADGARYVALREVAFDRDTDVTWDAFLRRYNADLANDFGNLVNRTVSMAVRYLGGERPAPGPAADARSPSAGRRPCRAGREARRLPDLTRRSRTLWEFVGGANKTVDAEAPWALAKAAKAGDEAAAARLAWRPRRPPRGLPPGGPRGGAGHAGRGAARPGAARLPLPVGRRRQRRAGPPRRAGLGRARRRGRHAGRPDAALPAPGDRCRRRPEAAPATAGGARRPAWPCRPHPSAAAHPPQ